MPLLEHKDSDVVARLSTLDAGFLEAEDSDRHVSLAVGSISVMAGPMPDYDALLAGFAERILAVPRFRQVLRSYPLDLGAPEWVEDPGFDLAHHIHHAALPPPGDDSELYRFAAEAMEARLDRDRPLWQCWIIEGLADGRWAILMKIHHSIADGISAMHLLAGLSDGGEPDTFVGKIRGSSEPAKPALRLPKPSLNPMDWVRGAWHTTSDMTAAAVQAAEGTFGILDSLLRPGTRSSLNGPVTTMRCYSAAQVSIRDVEIIRDKFDVTLNDVALAAITDSFRAALIRRGEEPRRDSLRTLVPVSVRSADAMDKTDNRVSAMLPYLPVDKADRVEQLGAVHQRLARAKFSGQREATSIFLSATKLIPFAITAWSVRALTRLPQRGVVTVATNVPGPRRALQIMGRDVVRLLPIPPLALRLRTGIAILSYGDQLVFGITADLDTAPDVDELASGIELAIKSLATTAAAG